jgi:Tol biopolymer transport system component
VSTNSYDTKDRGARQGKITHLRKAWPHATISTDVVFLRTLSLAILVTALAAPAAVQAADSVPPQLQQAIDLQTKGDLAGAAALFEKLSRDPDRSVAARALLHLGECRERQAQAGARQAYQRVVREFGDRPEVASEVRQRMAALGVTPVAALEIRQVWTAAPDSLGNVSSDGRLLAFVDLESSAVAVRDLRTGQSRRLTANGSSKETAATPRISPDGKHVVYSCSGNELRVVATDPASKAGPRTIGKNAGVRSITLWGWSPDGKSIAALLSRGDDSNELVWVAVADGTIRPLKSLAWRLPRYLDISPDGRFLVYDLPVSDTALEHDIFVMAADGTREFPLVHDPADDYAPLWTPDGQAVLFVSNRTGTPGLWFIPVIEGQAGGTPVLVKPDLGPALPLGITSGGALYYAERQGRDDIYTAAVVGGTPTRLIEKFIGRNSAPAWSPDGRLLAYCSNRESALDLVVRTVATGSERVFSGTPLDLRPGLRWMPDSKSLLVIAKDPPAGAIFSLLDAATGSLRPIARSTLTPVSLAVPPDGRSFLVAGAGVIRAYNVATGESRDVYNSPPGWILRNLTVSRDGSTLAFSVNHPALERTVIYTLPATGDEPREVARIKEAVTREGLTWTPDGHSLLFARSASPTQAELMRIPAEGGAPESTGLSGRGLSLLSIHPDGSRLAYTLGQYVHVDVWALENFLLAPGAAP